MDNNHLGPGQFAGHRLLDNAHVWALHCQLDALVPPMYILDFYQLAFVAETDARSLGDGV